MKKIFLLLTLFYTCSNSYSFTSINKGDIVFTGLNSGKLYEGFSFVTLAPLEIGTEFYITDCGWTGSAFQNNEMILKFTVISTISAGKEFVWESSFFPNGIQNNSSFSIQSISDFQSGLDTRLDNKGEQLFLFQGTISQPLFISAFTTNEDWQLSANSTHISVLPNELVNYETHLNEKSDNAIYNALILKEDFLVIKKAIQNPFYWNSNNTETGLTMIEHLFEQIPTQINYFYRSKKSGFWDDVTNWEISTDESFTQFSDALIIPHSFNKNITIEPSHRISIRSNTLLSKCKIKNGATLLFTDSDDCFITIVKNDVVDLIVEGTLNDNSKNSLVWQNGVKWQLAHNATIIRSSASSSVGFRENYYNGMSSIPSTANWIIRKLNSSNPSFTTVESFYPNLFFENETNSLWNANFPSSQFGGSSTGCTIKGNLTISGNKGTKIYHHNSNSNGVSIKGDLIIENKSILHLASNADKGAKVLKVNGNLKINGSLTYDSSANNFPMELILQGTQKQKFDGNGFIKIKKLRIDNVYGLDLNANIQIDSVLWLKNGNVFLNQSTVIIGNSSPTALLKTNGAFISENEDNKGIVSWKINNVKAEYTFPFIDASNQLSEISIKNKGNLGVLSISTYAGNKLPNGIEKSPLEQSIFEKHVLANRFWKIDSDNENVLVDLSFKTNNSDIKNRQLDWKPIRYNENSANWELAGTSENFDLTNLIAVTKDVTHFSNWSLIGNDAILALTPSIILRKNHLEILSKSDTELEFSEDGIHFSKVNSHYYEKHTKNTYTLRSQTADLYFRAKIKNESIYSSVIFVPKTPLEKKSILIHSNKIWINKSGEVHIYTTAGQLHSSIQIIDSSVIDLPNLSSCIIRYSNETENSIHKIFSE